MESKRQEKPRLADEEAPPAYEDLSDYEEGSDSGDDDDEDDEELARFETNPPRYPLSDALPLPCVIPQTTNAFRGTFFTPFVRAYVPQLESHGIQQGEFLTFIDGLNESFVAHPVFQGLGIVEAVMGAFYGIDPAQWAEMGLQAAAGVASGATSCARTREYVQATNRDLFHPAGLHLNIMSTKDMMRKVNYPEDKLTLPPLSSTADTGEFSAMKPKEAAKGTALNSPQEDDPRLRRIRALEGYVMPLNLDVPEASNPDNLLRQMGAAQQARMSRKQERRMNKRRIKGCKEQLKGSKKMDEAQRKGDRRMMKLETLQAENQVNLQRQLSMTDDPSQQRIARRQLKQRQGKIERKIARWTAEHETKLEKKLRKEDKGHSKAERREHKDAHKVHWLVISHWHGSERSDQHSCPGSRSEDEDHAIHELPA